MSKVEILNQAEKKFPLSEQEREAWLDYAIESIERYQKVHKGRNTASQGQLSRAHMQEILEKLVGK